MKKSNQKRKTGLRRGGFTLIELRDGKERQMLSAIETSSEEGMTTMNKSLADLVKRRLITQREAALYSPDREALLRFL